MPAMLSRLRTVAVILAGLVALATFPWLYDLSGLAVDVGAVRHWLTGDSLYGYRSPDTHHGTDLSPVAAMLLAPAAWLPLRLLGAVLALTGAAALVLALIALAGPVARRYGRSRHTAVLIAAALALLLVPARDALGLGHLDLILFGLVTADIVALRRNAWARSRAAWWPGPAASAPPRGQFPDDLLRRWWATGAWGGVGTGLAIALSIGPVLFLLYFVITRQWRAACTALVTAGTLLGAALLVAPTATAQWFTTALPQLDRAGPVGAPQNQSLAGVLARLYDPAGIPVLVWLSFAVLLVAVGLIRARSAHTDGDEIAAFTLVGLAGAAAGPVSRTHELIWVIPAVLILVDAAARKRATARRPRQRRLTGAAPITAALLVYLIFVADPSWTLRWNAYAITLVLLLNALPWRPGVAPARPTRTHRPIPAPRRVPAIPGPRTS